MSAQIEVGFDFINGKHVPTIKVWLSPCLPDDSEAWDARDALAKQIEDAIYRGRPERHKTPPDTVPSGEHPHNDGLDEYRGAP